MRRDRRYASHRIGSRTSMSSRISAATFLPAAMPAFLGSSRVGGEILRQAHGNAFSVTRLAHKQDVSPSKG